MKNDEINVTGKVVTAWSKGNTEREDIVVLLEYLDSLSRLNNQGVKVEREINLVTKRINELLGLK